MTSAHNNRYRGVSHGAKAVIAEAIGTYKLLSAEQPDYEKAYQYVVKHAGPKAPDEDYFRRHVDNLRQNGVEHKVSNHVPLFGHQKLLTRPGHERLGRGVMRAMRRVNHDAPAVKGLDMDRSRAPFGRNEK